MWRTISSTRIFRGEEGVSLNEQFFDDCTAGNLTAVESHIAGAGDLNLERGLCLAAQAGHTELAAYLLAQGAGKNRRSAELVDALYLASQNGHAPVVRLLLEAKVPVNVAAYFGRRALHAAATHGHAEVLRLLLAVKAKCDVRDSDGATPLAEAVLNGQHEAAQILVAAGADVNPCARDGSSPLSMAQEQDDQAMLALLSGTTFGFCRSTRRRPLTWRPH